VIALLHLSLSMSSHDDIDATSLGSSIGASAFTVPLIHFPSFIHPEFIAFHIPPTAAAAAFAAAQRMMLDCVYDIAQDGHAPPVFICNMLSSSPVPVEQRIVPASLLAAAAEHATGVSLEAPADAALHLLDQGDGVLDKLFSLQLNLWLVKGRYSPAVQQLLLLVAATHYLIHAAAVTENSFVDCSAASAPVAANLPPICMHLIYIHKRFVLPLPSRYSHTTLPFGKTNYSAEVECAGGHYFATLLNRQQPWNSMIPEPNSDSTISNATQQWEQRVPLESQLLMQQALKYSRPAECDSGCESSEENSSVKSINLGLTLMPLEEELVLDRCANAANVLTLKRFPSIFLDLPLQVHRQLRRGDMGRHCCIGAAQAPGQLPQSISICSRQQCRSVTRHLHN
jgi:hypothetical protein